MTINIEFLVTSITINIVFGHINDINIESLVSLMTVNIESLVRSMTT